MDGKEDKIRPSKAEDATTESPKDTKQARDSNLEDLFGMSVTPQPRARLVNRVMHASMKEESSGHFLHHDATQNIRVFVQKEWSDRSVHETSHLLVLATERSTAVWEQKRSGGTDGERDPWCLQEGSNHTQGFRAGKKGTTMEPTCIAQLGQEFQRKGVHHRRSFCGSRLLW